MNVERLTPSSPREKWLLGRQNTMIVAIPGKCCTYNRLSPNRFRHAKEKIEEHNILVTLKLPQSFFLHNKQRKVVYNIHQHPHINALLAYFTRTSTKVPPEDF